MASREQCDAAIRRLVAALDEMDPHLRRRLIPPRRASLVVPDLNLAYHCRLDGDGVHDLAPVAAAEAGAAAIRFSASSDELVRLSEQPSSFLSAWVHRRVGVHAGLRDLLELRRLVQPPGPDRPSELEDR
ncbi:MAG: hypothetical protein ACYCO3_03775 [Mycobacteriales bacterium]